MKKLNLTFLVFRKNFRTIIAFASFGFISATLMGCGEVHLAWEEEVRLNDGSVVVAKRTATRNKFGELGQRGAFLSWTIEIETPKRVVWVSEGSTRPSIIDIHEKIIYVAATVAYPKDCSRHNNPEGGAIFYKYENNSWKKISVKDFPRSLDTNLLLNAWNVKEDQDVRGFVSLSDKQNRDRLNQTRSIWQWISTSGRDSCRP